MLTVPVEELTHAEGLPLPAYQTQGSAGMDLHAAVEEEILLLPSQIVSVPSGLRVAIPVGYEGQVRSRSGLAKRGIIVPNAPGTIDSDYRGEIGVLLANFGNEPFTISRGDRIAQLVVAAVARVEWSPQSFLSDTERASGGFGSTGV